MAWVGALILGEEEEALSSQHLLVEEGKIGSSGRRVIVLPLFLPIYPSFARSGACFALVGGGVLVG
jgi:hypothetical protein